jgi:hypothetical protein
VAHPAVKLDLARGHEDAEIGEVHVMGADTAQENVG